MSSRVAVAFVPMAVVYLVMILGMVRTLVARAEARRHPDSKGWGAVPSPFEPSEMTLAALVLDVAGLMGVIAARIAPRAEFQGPTVGLTVAVGGLLLIIHLQIHLYLIRKSLLNKREVGYRRLIPFDLVFGLLAVLSNAATVLALVG